MIKRPKTPGTQPDEPDVLVSIWVNGDKKIEEIILVDNFIGGDFGNDIDGCYYDEYHLEYLLKDMEPDTLYHAYLHFHFSSCWTDCGTEYDMDVECLQLIPIKRNYSAWLDAQNEYEKQIELSNEDVEAFDNIITYGSAGGGRYVTPQITFNDLENIVKFIAEKDIRLAHRIITPYYAEKILEDKFDEQLSEIEERRRKFKEYLKYNDGVIVSFDEIGYRVKKRYGDKELRISYQQIDNLTDEMLLQYTPQDLFDLLVTTPQLLEQFDKYK